MAEEEGPDDETLVSTDFGKRAKDRVDTIKAWQVLRQCFFDSVTPRGKDTQRGRGVAEKALSEAKWSKSGQQSRPAPKK